MAHRISSRDVEEALDGHQALAADPGAVSTAVVGGDSLAILQRMREKLAATMDATESARDIATISREIDKLTERIDALKAAQGEQTRSRRDEIAARRAARESAAAV